MTNRYERDAQENEAQVKSLRAQIENFKARGVRLSSIPRIEAEIVKLEAQAKTLRATGKWTEELYGKGQS